MSIVIRCARHIEASILIEPVSAPRAISMMAEDSLLFGPQMLYPHHLIDMVTPNEKELEALYMGADTAMVFESSQYKAIHEKLKALGPQLNLAFVPLKFRSIIHQLISLLPLVPCIVATLGAGGCILALIISPGDKRMDSSSHTPYLICTNNDTCGKSEQIGAVYVRYFPAPELVAKADLIGVSGAGDSLAGSLMAGLVSSKGLSLEDLIPAAQQAAILTLKEASAVSPRIRSLKGSF